MQIMCFYFVFTVFATVGFGTSPHPFFVTFDCPNITSTEPIHLALWRVCPINFVSNQQIQNIILFYCLPVIIYHRRHICHEHFREGKCPKQKNLVKHNTTRKCLINLNSHNKDVYCCESCLLLW